MMRNDSESIISSLQNYGDSDEEEADSRNDSRNESSLNQELTKESGPSPRKSPQKDATGTDEVKGQNDPNDEGIHFSVSSPSLASTSMEIREGGESEGDKISQVTHSTQDKDRVENDEEEDRKDRDMSPTELISDEEADGEHLGQEGRRHHAHHHHHRSLADDDNRGDEKQEYPDLKKSLMEGLNTDSPSSQGSVKLKKKTARLVSYGPDEHDESSSSSEEDDEMEEESDSKSPEPSSTDTSLLSRSVRNMSSDEIRIPPEPPGKCPYALQKKIEDQYEHMRRDGRDLNRYIQSKKDFRNPSIYEKLIDFCHIDEKGTNFPPEIFDPHIWGKESFYDELDKAQRKDVERREKEKKERTKIEFLTGTKKSAMPTSHDSSSGPSDEKKRRSKWDAQPVPGVIHVSKLAGGQQSAPGVVNLTATATGTKATVIPAVGTLSKKPAGK